MSSDWLAEQLAEAAQRVALPCVAVEVGPPTQSPTASFAAGHPYLPDGEPWPLVDGRPGNFVAQINFAEVPRLAGYPTGGLLQWWVGGDDLYGLTFDESTGGAAGFAVRWWPDPDPDRATRPPSAPAPASGLYEGPLLTVGPGTSLVFRATARAPGWETLPAEEREHPVWYALAATHPEWISGRDRLPDPQPAAYDEWLRSPTGPGHGGSQIGGEPEFVQSDPRGHNRHFPVEHPAARLLLALDSAQVGGWGDAGVGYLFGDPAALARGEVSTLRWEWACA